MPRTELRSLLNARSVAVVGVSSDPNKLGSVVLNNIVRFGFQGEIYAVNPKYNLVFGRKCYPTLQSIPGKVDLALIVIPAQFVKESIKQCVEKKIGTAIIISAGFAETGAEGKALEEEIVQIAKEGGVRILGPNCLGVVFNSIKLNASFAAQTPREGNIAFLSQSGAFNTAMLDLADSRELGFRYFVSLGNKSDIDELDLLEAWLKDPQVKAVGAYLEEFEDGRGLLDIVMKNPDKPLIMLHPGASEEGKQAIASHTGSLSGSYRSIQSAFKQYGIAQTYSVEEMFGTLMLISWSPKAAGNRVAILTNAGGPGIITTDLIAKTGLKIAKLSDKTVSELQKVIPENGSSRNPVDILGDAQANRYGAALDILIKADEVDSIILILSPQLVTQIEDTAKLIVNISQVSKKPIVPIFLGEKYVRAGLERLWQNSVPAFSDTTMALKALDHLSALSNRTKIGSDKVEQKKVRGKYSDKVAQAARAGSAIPGWLASQIAQEVGLDLPKECSVNSVESLKEGIKKIGYPAVLKIDSSVIAHKTDQKLVYLNIQNEKELLEAFKELSQKSGRLLQNGIKESYLLQELLSADLELILGASKADTAENKGGFGYSILFGHGGIYTEVYADSAVRIVNASRAEVERMISETKVSQIIEGARGKNRLAKERVVDTLMALQKMVSLYPEISSVDINPAMLTEKRCVCADLKIFI